MDEVAGPVLWVMCMEQGPRLALLRRAQLHEDGRRGAGGEELQCPHSGALLRMDAGNHGGKSQHRCPQATAGIDPEGSKV